MHRFLLAAIFSANLLCGQCGPLDSLRTIRAFQLVTEDLACSGRVTEEQFVYIKAYGFTHVVSLLPGDQSNERSEVESMGMTFTRIPVEFGRPTMRGLKAFVRDMDDHRDEKIYLHCSSNMRASAFMYIYRVTRMGTGETDARATLNEIWSPTGKWRRFIERGLRKFGSAPGAG